MNGMPKMTLHKIQRYHREKKFFLRSTIKCLNANTIGRNRFRCANCERYEQYMCGAYVQNRWHFLWTCWALNSSRLPSKCVRCVLAKHMATIQIYHHRHTIERTVTGLSSDLACMCRVSIVHYDSMQFEMPRACVCACVYQTAASAMRIGAVCGDNKYNPL